MADIPYLVTGLLTCLLAGTYLHLRQKAGRLRRIRANLTLVGHTRRRSAGG